MLLSIGTVLSEKWIGKKVEGSSYGIILGAVTAFSQRDWRNLQKRSRRANQLTTKFDATVLQVVFLVTIFISTFQRGLVVYITALVSVSGQ
jgi:hypothetical protein